MNKAPVNNNRAFIPIATAVITKILKNGIWENKYWNLCDKTTYFATPKALYYIHKDKKQYNN